MMEYKALIKLFVPEIEETFELYIPINKTIGELSILLKQTVNSLSGAYPIKPRVELWNRRTNMFYSYGLLVRDTDIKNGTELVMIS